MPEAKAQPPSDKLNGRFAGSHAFIIGIDNYQELPTLSTAVNDARAIAQLLSKPFHGYDVHLYTDSTFQEMARLLKADMPKIAGEGSRILFYFAGHGIAVDSDSEGPQGYILPRDADKSDTARSISMPQMLAAFEQLKCRHFLLVLDCCFSGAFRWADIQTRPAGRLPRKIYQEKFDRYIVDPAWHVITSSSYDQESIDIIHSKALGRRFENNAHHSPFARCFLDALQGAADLVPPPPEGPNGLITATELYLYIRNKLEEETILAGKKHRQTPSFFPLKKHDKGEYLFLSPKSPLNLPHFNPGRNPYKGFAAYEPGDEDLFYGREKVSDELMRRVEQNPLTIVTGESGTGKSSLVRAGLLPRLKKENYQIYIMRPGEEPAEALEGQLAEFRKAKAGAPEQKGILLIDQFEEVLTRCQKEEERGQFLAKLTNFSQQPAPPLKIILTIRSDFEPQFFESPLWRGASRLGIPVLNTAEYREIIEQPAFQQVLHFDPPSLVDEIINDVGQKQGALPLLSFTLSELFEQYRQHGLPNNTRALTKAYYDTLGGIAGSLRHRARLIYQELGEGYKGSLRKAMLRMVSKEGVEPVSRRVYLDELTYTDVDETARIQKVVEALVEARLLVKGMDESKSEYVEPAHDALIRAWSEWWEWIQDFGEYLPLRDRLVNRIREYRERGEAENLLYHEDPRLDQLEAIRRSEGNWLNKQEEEFVERSLWVRERNKEREARRKRRIRRINTAFTIGLAIVGIVATFFWNDSRLANIELVKTNEELDKTNAELTQSNVAVVESRDSLKQTLDSLSSSIFENALSRAREAFGRKEFSIAVAECNVAFDLTLKDSLLRSRQPLVRNLMQEYKEKAAQYSLFAQSDQEASLLMEKDREGENLPKVLALFNKMLGLKVEGADKEIVEERKKQVIQRISLASQRAKNLAERCMNEKEYCAAFIRYKLSDHIKPGQKEVLQKMKELEKHVKEKCPENL